MVTFPFDLKMVDKKVDYSDGSRILLYTLKSDNNKNYGHHSKTVNTGNTCILYPIG